MRSRYCSVIGKNLLLNISTALLVVTHIFIVSSCQTFENPKNAKEQEILGSAKGIVANYLAHGEPSSALKELRPLMSEYKNDADLHNLMGLTQLALKNPKRATTHLRIAYKISPQIHIGLNLSSAYIEIANYGAAQRLLYKMLETATLEDYPNRERLFHNLGVTYLRQNQVAQAEIQFLKALEDNPAFYLTHLEMGRMYEGMGRMDKAGKSYKAATDYCSGCFEPVNSYAQFLIKQGKPQMAGQILKEFLKDDMLAPTIKAEAQALLNQTHRRG